MGLDIYLYHCKNKAAYEAYIKARDARIDFRDWCWEDKYKAESDRRLEAFTKWREDIEAKLMSGELKEFPTTPSEFTQEIESLADAEDVQKYNMLRRDEECRRRDAWCVELDDLYMRKVYWFTQFVYAKNEDRMVIDKNDPKQMMLTECYGFLTKGDVAELISKMEQLAAKPTVKQLHKTFPFNPKWVFGGPTYDYGRKDPMPLNNHYSTDFVNNYIKAYKAVYDSMEDDNVLVYMESY